MERIGAIAPSRLTQIESESTNLSSTNTSQKLTSAVSREKILSILAVLNKRWLTMGWRVMDPQDAEPMALAFIERLDKEAIPHQHYQELYLRAAGMRTQRMAQGLKVDDFSADMMAACWPALQKELREREVAAGRTLGANAESVCKHCLGTGFKSVREGEYFGTVKCDHGEQI